MTRQKPLIDDDGEIRELTSEDMKKAKPFSSLPESLQQTLRSRGQRGPQKAPTKERITIRLDADVVESYRALGDGWQSKMNADLKQAAMIRSRQKATKDESSKVLAKTKRSEVRAPKLAKHVEPKLNKAGPKKKAHG